MPTPICERAIEDAIKYQRAILKFISANDVGITGGHQYGYYLPKEVWYLFSPNPPEKGVNRDHLVTVTWPDGRITNSTVKWYGNKSRFEFRITGFGRDFPYRTFDNLGDLLVLIPKNINEFFAYVLDIGEDIDEIQNVLGVSIIQTWAVYEEGKAQEETEDVCLNKQFREIAQGMDEFPQVRIFSRLVRDAILDCVPRFIDIKADTQLIRLVQEEYTLYKMVERKIYQPEIQRLFTSIDDFLKTAQSILQARKSRAGRSLENHVEYLLVQSGIPHQMRPTVDNTVPDVIIPNKAAYDDLAYPREKLFILGIKTTCKDRWRQVLKEAPKIERKHILTLQSGITLTQLTEMESSNVTLIVPESLHKEYPAEKRPISIQKFLDDLKKVYV